MSYQLSQFTLAGGNSSPQIYSTGSNIEIDTTVQSISPYTVPPGSKTGVTTGFPNNSGNTINMYVWGGKVSSIKINTTQVATKTNYVASVPTGSTLNVTYTVAPTVFTDGGGRVTFLLFGSNGSSGLNGYLFKASFVSGEHAGQILRVTNGAVTDIVASSGSYLQPVNAAMLTGVFSLRMLYQSASKLFAMYVDGLLWAEALDNTYTSGAIGFGEEVAEARTSFFRIGGHPHIMPQNQSPTAKALIDLSENHTNKTLDYISDGVNFVNPATFSHSETIGNANFDVGSGSSVPGWSIWSPATCTIDTTTTPTTGHSLKIVGTGTVGGGMRSTLSFAVTPGYNYKIAGYQLSDGTTGIPVIGLSFWGLSGGVASYLFIISTYGYGGSNTPSSWQNASAVGQAPAGAVFAIVTVQNDAAAGTCWFKHITLSRVRVTDDEVLAGSLTGRASDIITTNNSVLSPLSVGTMQYGNSIVYNAVAGQNLLISATVGSFSGMSASAYAVMEVQRDGVYVYGASSIHIVSGNANGITFVVKDSPGAGNHTYRTLFYVSTGGGAANNVSLSVGELMC
jgi:hypothetical protein